MEAKKATAFFLENFLYNDFITEDFVSGDFVFDLQRFASAESEGRTERASEHKKRKAREEGRVALSKDLPAALITLFTFVTIYFLARYMYDTLQQTFILFFENLNSFELNDSALYNDYLLIPSIKLFMPIALIACGVALLSNYLQIGFKFTVKAIKPDFHKISPNIFKFFKNQVFSVTGFFNLIKSLVKIAIIVVIAYMTIVDQIEEIRNMIYVESVLYSMIFICKLAFSIVLKTAIILLVFSIIDILFVRWQYEESLKMKKEEVKQEVKELYGDPNVKSRLRRMYQDLLSQKRMLEEVPKADVVITNPTHFAVALYYDRFVDDAPRVTAKGKDAFAQKIKEVAKENNIYMYENVELAQTLYREVEVKDIIPKAMYGLVINAYKLAIEYKDRQKVGV